MAIQNRRGIYSDFDPTKMVEGEFAVVQSGDPNTSDGKAVYIAPTTGTAERVALYKDLQQEVQAAITDATDEVIQEVTAGIIEGVTEDVTKAETAATNAETSAQNAEASAEEAQEVLENKADNNGYYPDLYAGNLSSTKKQTDSVPYLMRKTGGDLSRIGEREDDTLVGATVNVNQLVDTDTSSVTIQSGHKYYAKISGTESIGASTGTAIAVTGGTDMVVDLTAKFGSTIADYLYSLETATAGAGIAKLREWGFLTDEYIPYNEGSLESVEATAHKMVGFNQWDEETESGYVNPQTGAEVVDSTKIRMKNFMPVLPNTTYYKKSPTTFWNVYFDADKNYIGFGNAGINQTFTTPNNCRYIRCGFESAYGTTYNHDICINLSSDRNGEYEPYSAHTYDLGTDTLRGLFKLDASNNLYADGDTKTAYGTVTRKYKKITIDENTTLFAETSGMPFRFVVSDKKIYGFNELPNMVSDKLQAVTQGSTWGIPFTIAFASNTNSAYFKLSDDITTIEQAQTYLTSNPITIVYELATPTTEQSTPFTSPQICDPDGTEEYVTENGVPAGHETEYDYDIKGLAEELIDVPDVPSSNGTYVLKATRSASGISYEWVSEA